MEIKTVIEILRHNDYRHMQRRVFPIRIMDRKQIGKDEF
jgi:hypothetical protein